jgi:AraC family transcriptional regulator
VESCAVGVMIEVGRYLRNTRDRQELRRATLASWQLRRIDQYLNECSDHSPTIADLAKQAGVSRGHLTRLFKATTGVTVHDYVVEVRVRRAKTFLSDTDLPLKVISARLGFSRPTSFSLAFRQAVGESPRVFRQQFRTRHAGAGLKKTLTRKPRRS